MDSAVDGPGVPASEIVDMNLDIEDATMDAEEEIMDFDEARHETDTGVEHAVEFDVMSDWIRPEAILLNGVDHMSTDQVKKYASTFFAEEDPKVEWVNDSTVLLVYKSGEAAKNALDAFTSEAAYYDEPPQPKELRNAKSYPDVEQFNLKVRMALMTDKKEKKAALKSRYYLFYGDPREAERDRRNGRTDRSKRGRREHRRRSRSPTRDLSPVEYISFRRDRSRERWSHQNRSRNLDRTIQDIGEVHSARPDRYAPTRADNYAPDADPRRLSRSPDPYRRPLSPVFQERTRSPKAEERWTNGEDPAVVFGGNSESGLSLKDRIGIKSKISENKKLGSDLGSRLGRRRAHHLEFE
ncbi:uncharacterized protein V1516DRAFT_691300 [Lipomyces oligophaga]|uniref:uncharacterized protein n=1 Tax=Lipomyces oligophaga TaxID=45792 RepID=UPI0034CD1AB2